MNLLVNARDAVGDGGWIRVATRAPHDGGRPFAEIVVEDGGCGIPQADLAHLFEPFFTTKGTHGTGLGLAVTWGIVEAHGGTIDVASEVGKGSRFTVRLPIPDGPEALLAGAVPAEETRHDRAARRLYVSRVRPARRAGARGPPAPGRRPRAPRARGGARDLAPARLHRGGEEPQAGGGAASPGPGSWPSTTSR